LQLVRVPNLLTVPGDPLAGGCLAVVVLGGGSALSVLPAACVSLLLYAAGLVLNDCFDLAEDRAERPGRPLPSGAVSPRQALGVASVLVIAGLWLAYALGPTTGTVTSALFAMILLYNGLLKRHALAGALAMGLCRALSVLVGATAVGGAAALTGPVMGAALCIAAYISAVTGIADQEHRTVPLGPKPGMPVVVLLVTLIVLAGTVRGGGLISLFPLAVAIGIAMQLARMLKGAPDPAVVQPSIGRYIRLLLLIQAGFCFVLFPAGAGIGLALVLLWPLSGWVGRWFYAS
jgi:hypothetical protein